MLFNMLGLRALRITGTAARALNSRRVLSASFLLYKFSLILNLAFILILNTNLGRLDDEVDLLFVL